MAAPPSIAVIGAGVAGLSVALRAAELGATVTVIERGAPRVGLVRTVRRRLQHQQHRAAPGRGAGPRARPARQVRAENGLHLARIGYLRLAKNDRPCRRCSRTVIALQRELGAEPSKIVDPARLREIVPHLRTDDLVGAIYNPRDGHTDGPLLVRRPGRARRGRGRHGPAPNDGHRPRGGERRHRARDRRAAPVEADVVVNAAGAWARRSASCWAPRFPLVNQRHEVIKVRLPGGVDYTVPMVQEYIPGEEEAGYFRQDGPSTMIAGMHTYAALDQLGSADPDDYQRAVEWETWEAVAKHVSNRLQVDGLGFETGWTGLYPISADGELRGRPLRGGPDASSPAAASAATGIVGGLGVGPAAAEWARPRRAARLPRGDRRSWPDRASLPARRLRVSRAAGSCSPTTTGSPRRACTR